MAKIEIRITERGETYRKGNLFIDGRLILKTLEDCDRMLYKDDPIETILLTKQKHYTAIPYGTYDIEMSYSIRFSKRMPYVLDVPGFDGIMFHIGNHSADSSGCILVGTDHEVGEDWLMYSKTGMRILLTYLYADELEKHTLTITPN